MDTLTHALSGALLARATAKANPSSADRPAPPAPGLRVRTRVGLGFLAAAFPDTDIVLTWVSPITYITQHRGLTHSWLMLPLWSLLLAWVLSRLRRDPRGVRPYLGVLALGIGIHILGDWITSFGTMMLAPLSNHRFALGTTFIIDLLFTGIILAGLLGSMLWRASRLPALAGLAILCGYVALQWVQQQRALAFGEQYAQAQGLSDYQVAALPRPLSPFNWSVYVTAGERYRVAHVNLRRAKTPPPAATYDSIIRRLSAGYRPLHDAQWQVIERFGTVEAERNLAREAWSHSELGFYRWFAVFPMLDHIERGNPATCVWFRDARFDIPGRDTRLFHYGLCRKPGEAAWHLYKLNNDGSKSAI